MTVWLTKIQKRIDTNAKFKAWLGCITKLCANLVNKMQKTVFSLFCLKLKSIEEVTAPKDYEVKHWHKFDWEKWVQNNKDDWN